MAKHSTPNNNTGNTGNTTPPQEGPTHGPDGLLYPAYVRAAGARGARLFDATYQALTQDDDGPQMAPDVAVFVIEQHWPDMLAALAPDEA